MYFLLSAVVAALLVGSSCTTPAIEASAPVRGSPSPAASTPSPPANARQVRVVRVVDGDTLVLDGFALPMTVPPNVRYAELFVELAARAREAQRGLWKVC